MLNPTAAEILAANTSLVKDDPRIAEGLVSILPAGSPRHKKVVALKSIVTKLTLPLNAPPVDPIGYLQKAVHTVLYGPNFKGNSLSRLIDLTNPLDPISEVYFIFREVFASLGYLTERRTTPAIHGDYPVPAVEYSAHIGYLIDARRLRQARQELHAVQAQRDRIDERINLAFVCMRLVEFTLLQVKDEIELAGNGWLEMIAEPGKPGVYHLTISPERPIYAVGRPDPAEVGADQAGDDNAHVSDLPSLAS